jgi:16S rRNA (cytidine1402-2'-O)-methyltransferase
MEAGERAQLMSGTLYIVATPIGNLGDISERALAVLRSVALIAVEDTRHSGRLLQHFGIATPMLAYHDFSDSERAGRLLEQVAAGASIALISDAGTPLISDPGYQLVRQAHARRLHVVPVPGPSAVIAALCSAGLASDRFTFEGFLPARAAARASALAALKNESRTMVFHEAPHRIVECLVDMQACFGGEREITLARELTKTFETIIHTTLEKLLQMVRTDPNQQKGEIVLVVAGHAAQTQEFDEQTLHTLRVLLGELPLKQAAALAAQITGSKKNLLYEQALRWKQVKD